DRRRSVGRRENRRWRPAGGNRGALRCGGRPVDRRARCGIPRRLRTDGPLGPAGGVAGRAGLSSAYRPRWRTHGGERRGGDRPRRAFGGGRVVRGRVVARGEGSRAHPGVRRRGALIERRRMTAIQPSDRFGIFGGRYVPETLIPALDEL